MDKPGQINWVRVYSGRQMHIIVVLMEMLDEQGIPSHFINKMDSFYPIGDIELYVPAEDLIRAKYIISKSKL